MLMVESGIALIFEIEVPKTLTNERTKGVLFVNRFGARCCKAKVGATSRYLIYILYCAAILEQAADT